MGRNDDAADRTDGVFGLFIRNLVPGRWCRCGNVASKATVAMWAPRCVKYLLLRPSSLCVVGEDRGRRE